MKATQWAGLLISLGLWCSQSQAIGIPRFNLEKIGDQATSIVVADVKESRDIGPAPPVQFRDQALPAEAYSVYASVRETLKGPTLRQITVIYSLPTSPIGYHGPHPGLRILFLRSEKGHYSFADPYYPDFPATLTPTAGRLSAETYSEAVLRDMMSVLASPTASAAEKFEILRVDYAFPNNATTISALTKAVSSSNDPDITFKLQGELIRLGDVKQLPTVTNALLQGSPSPQSRQWLLSVIAYFLKNEHAIPDLQRLARSPNDSLREAAFQALSHIGAESSAPTLIKALDDPDEKVRLYAVRGLADIANEYGWGEPTEPEFREHQQKYLAHWREWAKNRVH